MPARQQGETQPHVTVVGQHFHHEGPLPHPQILASYEQVLPGAAERIFQMAEREQRNRHDTADKTMRRETRREMYVSLLYALGQVCGFLLGMSGIWAGTWLSYQGKNLVGFGTFIGSLGALVGVFI
jgi:uncharacterized membrane protein